MLQDSFWWGPDTTFDLGNDRTLQFIIGSEVRGVMVFPRFLRNLQCKLTAFVYEKPINLLEFIQENVKVGAMYGIP